MYAVLDAHAPANALQSIQITVIFLPGGPKTNLYRGDAGRFSTSPANYYCRIQPLTILLKATDCAHALHDGLADLVQGEHTRLAKDTRGITADLMRGGRGHNRKRRTGAGHSCRTVPTSYTAVGIAEPLTLSSADT